MPAKEDRLIDRAGGRHRGADDLGSASCAPTSPMRLGNLSMLATSAYSPEFYAYWIAT